MRSNHIHGLEHASAQDALNFSGDRAIGIGGRYFTVEEAEYQRIQEQGFQHTIWRYFKTTGRIMSVPGKH